MERRGGGEEEERRKAMSNVQAVRQLQDSCDGCLN